MPCASETILCMPLPLEHCAVITHWKDWLLVFKGSWKREKDICAHMVQRAVTM